jgi:hypothetical protein
MVRAGDKHSCAVPEALEVDMTPTAYEIQYQPLTDQQGPMRFPCDGQGHVDLDGLSPQAAENYLFARAMVGRDFALPEVVAQEA